MGKIHESAEQGNTTLTCNCHYEIDATEFHMTEDGNKVY